MGDQALEQSAVEDRMMALLDIEDPPEEEQEPQEESAQEETPPEEQQPEEAPPETKEQRLFRLKHDGVEIEKPEEEVIALAQQGFDYTQKTQKLAEERKVVEEHAQAIKAQEQAFAAQVQVQQALSQDIAKVTAIDSQLSQYQNLDWQALSNTDPVEAQKLFFSYTQLKTQREQVAAEVNNKHQAFLQFQNQTRAQQIEAGKKILEKEIPGWGTELAKTLVETGKSYGFNDQELSGLTDPRTVKLLHDAAQWKKFQASKSVADKKVGAASPVVKAGAKDTKNAANANLKTAREALKKTGNQDYAAQLIEKML